MTSRVIISRFAQKAQTLTTYHVRRATSSCSGPKPDPPCECIAPPSQTCRTVVSHPAPVMHVLCKPPPPAPPPPCPPCEPTAPLTCTNYVTREEVHSKRPLPLAMISSELDHLRKKRDRVACRLARAERSRQFDYEQEAALEPPPRPLSAPLARFQLGNEEHLTPDDECHIRRVAYSDPCAHRPRLQLKVQRTVTEPPPTLNSSSQLRTGNATSRGRCERTVPPVAGPARCRPPSIVERLRSLSRSAENGHHPGDRRSLHTTAGTDITIEADGLTKALQSRERLQEAGRGRVACSAGATGSARTCVAGTLELSIPEGARRLLVRVTLEDGDETQAGTPVRKACSASGNTPDSWLSMKNIQNKFIGNKKDICSLAEQKKSPGTPPCARRVTDATGTAGAGGAGRCGTTALLSVAPVPSK